MEVRPSANLKLSKFVVLLGWFTKNLFKISDLGRTIVHWHWMFWTYNKLNIIKFTIISWLNYLGMSTYIDSRHVTPLSLALQRIDYCSELKINVFTGNVVIIESILWYNFDCVLHFSANLPSYIVHQIEFFLGNIFFLITES